MTIERGHAMVTLRTLQLGILLMIVVGAVTFYLLSRSPESIELTTPVPSTESVASASSGFPIHDEPKPLPALAFIDGNRQKRTLASFEGKLVLLNIWATWCAPCREEMPTLDRLQAMLGSTSFEVVALSIDNAEVSLIEDFYAELGLEALADYVDPAGSAMTALNVVGIPATLLLSPQGDEIGRMLGPAEWDAPEMVDTIRMYLSAE